VILFLHGSGQGDGPVENVAATGLPQRLKTEEDFPFIVISPQLPRPQNATTASGIDDFMVQYGWDRWIEPLEGLLGWLETHLAIDPQREYLTGLSMGGFGTWEYARRYPDRFAAIAPIAGGLEFSQDAAPEDICRLKDLPIWAFHGEKDTTVLPSYTKVLIEALRACGGSPKITLYPNEGHSGSWNQAYSGQDLFNWMLSYPK
jgi:predicted peptidase